MLAYRIGSIRIPSKTVLVLDGCLNCRDAAWRLECGIEKLKSRRFSVGCMKLQILSKTRW